MGAKESRLPKPPCDPHKSWIPWRCDDDRPSQGILVGGWVGGWVRVRVGGFVSVGGWASDKPAWAGLGHPMQSSLPTLTVRISHLPGQGICQRTQNSTDH